MAEAFIELDYITIAGTEAGKTMPFATSQCNGGGSGKCLSSLELLATCRLKGSMRWES